MKSNLRIISGTLKGKYLKGPLLNCDQVRPTSNRAREALFSILQHYHKGSFLDLFSGTGAIAIEAWSRGYYPVTCVEAHATECIKYNIKDTDIKILTVNACQLSSTAFTNQSVIFADPPYKDSAKLWSTLVPNLVHWLAINGGVIIWETDPFTILDTHKDLSLITTRRYGNNVLHIFTMA